MTVRTLAVGGMPTNCYLVWDAQKRAAVIDPGADAPLILQTAQNEGLCVEAVLLTHAHFDHIGAAAAVARQTNAAVYIEEQDAAALSDSTRNLASTFCTPIEPVDAVRTLRDGDEVAVGSLIFTVLHTPGHTAGSCCYLCRDTLFSGDTLFCESIGRTDFPSGDPAQMMSSLRRLLALAGDKRVLPGHEEETTLSHERRYNPYCR